MTKRKKAAFLALAAAVLAAAALAAFLRPGRDTGAVYGENLLVNPDFEVIDGEGMPEDWLADAYLRAPGITAFDLVEGLEGRGIRIRNHEPNDARFAQTVPVRPDTLYCLSGFVRADARGGRGANLSVADVYVFSRAVYETGGEWEELLLYGRTGKNQRSVTLFARLGGYSGEASGEAVFDRLSLTAVKEVPPGYSAESWEPQSSAPPPKAPSDPGPAWPWLLLTAVFFTGASLWLARFAQGTPAVPAPMEQGKTAWQAAALLLAALASRLAVAVLVPGYGVDIGCFTAWADRMAAVGPRDFYAGGGFSDYPPGYMLILWPIGLLGRLFGTGATEWMVKLPPILCDLALAALLFRHAMGRMGSGPALALTALFAFNPLAYATGAAWGQIDSLPALLILITVLLAEEGRWAAALPVYVASVLMKPQALMFGPLGLVAAVTALIPAGAKRERRSFALGLGLAAVTAAVIVLPFSLGMGDPGWIFSLYSGTMTYYAGASVNALNLYFLFGKNWGDPAQTAPLLMKLAGLLTLLVPAALLVREKVSAYRKAPSSAGDRYRRGILPACAVALAAVALVLLVPMSQSALGILMMALSFAAVAGVYALRRDIGNLSLLGAVLLTAFFVLGVMMHERYLFAAVPLLLLAYIKKRDRELLALLLAVSALVFLNVGVVLDRGVRIGGVEGHLSAPDFGIASDSAALEYLLSGFSLLVAGLAFHAGFRLSLGSPPRPPRPLPARQTQALRADPLLSEPWTAPKADRKDAGWMLAITGLYALLALLNLGSLKAPQHPWVSGAEETEARADLGEIKSFELLYYGGIHWRDSDFLIDVSRDGETWETHPAQMRQGDCFSWKVHSVSYQGNGETVFTGQALRHEGRYVRIRASAIGLTLMEAVLMDPETGTPLVPVWTDGAGKALFDEQDAFSGLPDWRNSMYFDEIYHARTAYEQLLALRGQAFGGIYETSHPPLGKLLMTLSLAVFGMTPFGWRFAGALAGILMIPGLYLCGRLLTRRRLGGILPALLMALDCMHFAQTRIATIDSFVVLFILWSVYFMLRYVLLNYYARPFRRSLADLGLSGLFIGLAIASKWTGLYAGAGLAVIFFWSLWRRVREGRVAKRLLAEKPAEELGPRASVLVCAAATYKKRALAAVLWCFPFFVLVPALIYLYSFIPVYAGTPGGLSPARVIAASQSMLAYHATPGLGMDHPFHSPWYEWPLSLRPMWFFAGGRENGSASTILTFGNPAVWWGGLAALVCLAAALPGRLVRAVRGKGQPSDAGDMREGLLLILYLAQYLPWVLVPRGTYIYHYFPLVPLIVLAAALFFDRLSDRAPGTSARIQWAYLALAALLFAGFFPYVSGLRVSTAWLDAMNWFPHWLYY